MPAPSETRCWCWGTPGRNSAARSCGRPCTASPAASRRAWISQPSADWSITWSPGRSAGCSAPHTIARRAGWASRSRRWRWAARTTRRASAWRSILPLTARDLRLSSCCSASLRGEPSSHAPPTASLRWRRWRRSWACRPSASVRWACGAASCGSGCATRSSRTPSTGCARYISRRYPDAWETDGRMCGIIGVTGVPDAARVAYLGLYSLQHRGQESAGMVAVDGEGVARSHRGMGLVSDVFSERVLNDLPGDVAIGHTRYSTAGTSVLANAQPMLARYREGPLAVTGEHRLGVGEHGGAGGRVPRVADRDVARQIVQHPFTEDVRDEPHAAVRAGDALTVHRHHPRRLLPAVLQAVEAEIGDAGCVGNAGDADDAAHPSVSLPCVGGSP